MASDKVTVGILSIGDMGLGIARLLVAEGYGVVTCSVGRSAATNSRIESVKEIVNYSDDVQFVQAADVILSIIPPGLAVETARRVLRGLEGETTTTTTSKKIFVDLNAISPMTAKKIEELFRDAGLIGTGTASPARFVFLDGGIIGGPPSLDAATSTWKKPSLVTSGPDSLSTILPSPTGDHLTTTLNITHISPSVGSASCLKCCFASLTKGLTALSILSFTTAKRGGVLSQLFGHLDSYSPMTGKLASKGITGMPPKAYRWVDEMKEIGKCFAGVGGLTGDDDDDGHRRTTSKGNNDNDDNANDNEDDDDQPSLKDVEKVFEGFGELYRFVSDGTVLGEEKTELRKRGRDVEDVAECMVEGLTKREEKKKKRVKRE